MKIEMTVVSTPNRTYDLDIADFPKLSESDGKYAITRALQRTALQEYGTRVPIYIKVLDLPLNWCSDNIKGLWDSSRDEVLSSPTILRLELMLAAGDRDTSMLESMWSASITRMCDHDAAEAEGRIIPHAYFWFENTDEAMLFKLARGGM